MRLGVHRRGEVHGHLLHVAVELVPGLLGHRERAGQRDLGGAIRVAAEELHVPKLHRVRAKDPADHPRHRGLVAGAIADHAGVVDVHAVERGGEPVRIALAPDLAVAHDVDAGSLHVADGDHGGIVLRLLQEGLGHPPHRLQADARNALRQHRPVDEPVGLRIAADHRGREHRRRRVVGRWADQLTRRG